MKPPMVSEWCLRRRTVPTCRRIPDAYPLCESSIDSRRAETRRPISKGEDMRLYADFLGGPRAVALLFLRLVAGSAFVFHGWPKIQHPTSWMGPEAPVPGVLQALAAISEFGGGLSWILGALTPLFSLGLIGTM